MITQNEANTEQARVLSGEKRGDGVLSGWRKGAGSYSGECRGSSVLTGMRGKATAVTWTGRENSETVAKQEQLLSAGLDINSVPTEVHVSTNY